MGQAGLAKPASMAMLCLALPNFRAAAKVAARGWNFEEVMAIDGGEAAIRMIIASVLAEHGEIGGPPSPLAAMRQAEATVRASMFRGMPCSYSSWTTELKGLPEGSRPTRRHSRSPTLPEPELA
jgi:hypothetical protein